ncbi:GNAT family N-acetyltransferase [Paenibacillus lactis]|uniref:GCN5-related N-acetyltransferase n=1 Tax=Paenibacillus lactis 154 TaxID=743719 RepID=G4HME3_9BACL|nr:GNAT family N-acetyltransferase [Paenibacillus lactis]EHB54470.1 GCN5-related N-acetyltransferase [Paenibacillus lactis 154]
MTIRSARPEDAAAASKLLYDALHDIAHQLTGEDSKEGAVRVLEQFFREHEGRLSHKQAAVKEIEGKAAGIIVAYGGDQAPELDRPIIERLRRLKHDDTLTLDKEADVDEYYIDTLSVSPAFGGQGIGTSLIGYMEERARELGYGKIALAVVQGNERAFALYERRGYATDKEIMINGHVYRHMVKML